MWQVKAKPSVINLYVCIIKYPVKHWNDLRPERLIGPVVMATTSKQTAVSSRSWWNLFQTASVMNMNMLENVFILSERLSPPEKKDALKKWRAESHGGGWRVERSKHFRLMWVKILSAHRSDWTLHWWKHSSDCHNAGRRSGGEMHCGVWMALIDGLSCFYFQVLAVKLFVSDMGFPKKKRKERFLFSKSISWAWWLVHISDALFDSLCPCLVVVGWDQRYWHSVQEEQS